MADSDNIRYQFGSIARQGEGQWPPTVSAPGIHYTTTVDARAFVNPGSIYFVAYNRTYEKRILHVLDVRHGLSFYEQRPLYIDDDARAQSTTSLFDLLCEKFSDEPASLHIMNKKPFSTDVDIMWKLVDFHEEFYRVSSKLPHMPFGVQIWAIPEPPPLEKTLPGPRMIEVTKHATHVNEGRRQAVVIDGYYLPVNRNDK